ncbi:MAG: NAD(P)H-dependent oxidoreductase, partial [Bacillota bacterium]|nr:NAD(P)H-dependent oxidoreductase [Bacillota bacterium]
MEITIIHGQAHKGSTYHISSMIKERLADKDTIVNEYFMPKDGPDYCVGCFSCIIKCEEYSCPQADKVQKILASMLRSKILIIDSPNYCFEMTGQLKSLFDHYAYIWMPHRPRKEMFSKIGIVISTAAGGGAKNVTKSIARQLFYWGVPKIYSMHFNVNASCFEDVPEKIKKKISNKADKVSKDVKGQAGIVKPDFKTKLIFNIMRKIQSSNNWNKKERA